MLTKNVAKILHGILLLCGVMNLKKFYLCELARYIRSTGWRIVLETFAMYCLLINYVVQNTVWKKL